MTARYPMPADTRDAVMRRNGGRCEAGITVGGCYCTGRAEVVHHRAGRAFPECNDPRLLLAACEPCHSWIHLHPTASYAAGWMIRRTGLDVARILSGEAS